MPQEAFEEQITFNIGQILSIPYVINGIWLMVRKPKATQPISILDNNIE